MADAGCTLAVYSAEIRMVKQLGLGVVFVAPSNLCCKSKEARRGKSKDQIGRAANVDLVGTEGMPYRQIVK
jgi:hypothetical protein